VLLSSVATAQPKSKVACGWTDDQYGTRDPHETLCASLMGGAQCVDSLD